MAESTGIEWCDSTFNPWIGCTKVSPACDDCYAARSTPARAMHIIWGAGQSRHRTAAATWSKPRRWNASAFFACAACGWRGEPKVALPAGSLAFVSCASCGADAHPARRRVFCASLADVFDNEVPTAWRVDLLRLIEATPNLDWLLLTKRIGNVERLLDEAAELMPEVLAWPLPNVWLGATVVNQAEADRDVPKLLAVPARVRFLSIEPMLGAIDLRRLVVKPAEHPARGQPPVSIDALRGWFGGAGDPARLQWVIAGGESGPKARPSHPDWFRSLRDQCAAAGVPFLFKQHGEWAPDPDDDRGATCFGITHSGEVLKSNEAFNAHAGDAELMFRVGKKAAGRLLDGAEHNGFPEVAHG